MNKFIMLIALLSCLWAVDTKMPTNETNIVGRLAEVASINYTTISDTLPLFDAKHETSTDIKSNKNAVVIQLRHPFYIREIKVYTPSSAAPESFMVRHSKTADQWTELTSVTTANEGDFLVFTINGEYVLASYLSFIGKTANTAKLSEIEVYPETSMRLKAYYIKDHWQVTDTEAFNDIDTRIDTQQTLKYSEFGATSLNKFALSPIAKLEGELISLGNLKPGNAYEYKMSVGDYNGNILNLDTRQFNTRPLNFAAKKTYTSTFTTRYDGRPVSVNTYPLTDGSTDINYGLALSGSVRKADQFVIIDLGQNKTISEVVLYWRALGYSKDYQLELSTDKQNWTTVAQHLNADIVPTARTNEGHPLKAVFTKFKPTSARYVRLFIAKDSAVFSKHNTAELELFEFKVF